MSRAARKVPHRPQPLRRCRPSRRGARDPRARANAAEVQRFLNALPYNTEPPPAGATQRTFRGVIQQHTAHCLEAALTAAVILEHTAGRRSSCRSSRSTSSITSCSCTARGGRWGSVGAVARSRTARPQAGLRHAARARAQLRGRLRRFQRPDHRLHHRRSARLGQLRLAAVRRECLEGRADAAANCRTGRMRHVRRAHRSTERNATANTARATARKPFYYRVDRWMARSGPRGCTAEFKAHRTGSPI